MSSHMPPIPPANRSQKGAKNGISESQVLKDQKLVKHEHHANAAEEGHTANIKQNTTNKATFGDAVLSEEFAFSGVAGDLLGALSRLHTHGTSVSFGRWVFCESKSL